jgi:cold-inducible RNA-binding protein
MKNIYVGNLSFRVSEDSVRSMFEKFGTVERVSISRNRHTGERRAFGFVEMSNIAEADRAIAELNERELDGRTLNVAEAPLREEGDRGYRVRSSSSLDAQTYQRIQADHPTEIRRSA